MILQKVKVDRYLVSAKGRIYEILQFPFIKHMWAFDGHPANPLIVDGSKEAYTLIQYAFAILANFPDKIIYFPCRQNGIGRYYNTENYNLVLCRPEAQLRRSLWFKLHGQLDTKHAAGKFVFQYDRKKLDDYYETGLWKHYPMREIFVDRPVYPAYVRNEMQKEHVEEILGDTMFMVCSRKECFYCHYHIAKDMDGYVTDKDSYICTPVGWIVSEGDIESMYEWAATETEF